MNSTAHRLSSPEQPPAPPPRGVRRGGPTSVDRSAQQRLVDELVADRVAQRERGEIPPLPDPLARRRGGRLARMACGIELQQRELDGTITDEEQEWLALRREHLAEWQQQRAQRFAIRAARAARAARSPRPVDEQTASASTSASTSPAPRSPRSLRAVTADQWRGQLTGPNDLRALVARVRGFTDDDV